MIKVKKMEFSQETDANNPSTRGTAGRLYEASLKNILPIGS